MRMSPTQEEAMKMALEALEGKRFTACGWRTDCDVAITALRAALAEPVQPEEHCLWARNGNEPCPHVQQAEPVQEPDYWQEEARRYAGNADYWRKRYEALAEPPKPASLKRGTTGRCTRKVCECEKEGLGLECIHLEPVVEGYPLWSGIPKVDPVQEPVGVVTSMVKGGVTWHRWPGDMPDGTTLYAAPPQRPAEPHLT